MILRVRAIVVILMAVVLAGAQSPVLTADPPLLSSVPVTFSGTGFPTHIDVDIEVFVGSGPPQREDNIVCSSDKNGDLVNCIATKTYPSGPYRAVAYKLFHGQLEGYIAQVYFTVS